MPAWLNLALAIFVLVVVAAYLSWVGRRQRAVGRDNWQITLPGGRLTLVQIGIGILDLGLSSFAMYLLLPGGPSGDFVAILVTFIFATLLGFASHSPGGLGVFDAAMLIASPQFEKETLLASLLLFRLLYYVVPFALALTLVGGRELYASLRAPADLDEPPVVVAWSAIFSRARRGSLCGPSFRSRKRRLKSAGRRSATARRKASANVATWNIARRSRLNRRARRIAA